MKMIDKDMTFEKAMERLEDAARALESGSLGLDAAMKTYEEAVELLRFCHGALENAERRVSILLDDEKGALSESAFDMPNET